MSKTVNSKILVRRDTSTNWSTNNPILAAGEIGFDTTVGKHKIGDGSTAWNSLPYFLLETGDAHRTLAIPYAEVDSTSTSTVFTATVDGITELYDGVCVYLKNGVVSSASGWTLNINNLGAKPVYQSQAAASRVTTIFNVAYTALFIYNSTRVEGGCWDYFYGYNSDTNTTAYQTRQYQTLLLMYAALTRYKICFSRFDGKILPATATSNSTGTTKALTTDSFNPFGLIYYYSTTTGVAADASPGASYMWLSYPSIDLRYSFNAGSTLTVKQDVFVKCSPQSDGSVKLSGNDCIVQSLPNSEDGYVYIYLGKAYSTYQITMDSYHPIYYYKDGIVRLWTNERAENTLFVEVTGEYDDQNDEFDYEISNNITYANIASAIENNKNVIVILTQDNEYKQYFNFSYFNYDDEVSQPIIFANNSQGNICTLEIDSNSDVSISNEYDLSNFITADDTKLIGSVNISGTTATFTGLTVNQINTAWSNGIPVLYHYVHGEGNSEYVIYQLVDSYYANSFQLDFRYVNSNSINTIHVNLRNVSNSSDTFTGTLSVVTIPTQVSDLTNDAGYQTSSQVSSAISSAIANINSFNVSIVQSLPTTNIDTHTIYFISNSGSSNNSYDEYIYINNAWQKIGTTEVDLSNYAVKSRAENSVTYLIQNEDDYDFGLRVYAGNGNTPASVFLNSSGVTISGNTTFQGAHVGNSNAPTYDTDYTNKVYVDSLVVTQETDANVIAMLANFGLNTTTQLQPATIGTTTAGASVLKL